MKVLSIKEPWASLIKDGKKKIETRSWKTNYRGDLYIHASLTKINKEIKNKKDLMSIVGDTKPQYGKILCRCKLIDCIEMTPSFLEKINNNRQEYICGEYLVGRYAWILDNIEPLNIPIQAKGKLGIWNYEK